MEYLTPSLLKQAAPAAQKLGDTSGTLIDTAAFLRNVEKRGFKPIFAAQGTPHGDSQHGANKGRHLVVVADKAGNAIALLNSHTVHRKAWLGAGFAMGVGDEARFLIGPAFAIARWKGLDIPLDELQAYRPGLLAVKGKLEGWEMDTKTQNALARAFVESVYLPGHKTCSSESLVPDWQTIDGWSAYASLMHMMAQVMTGSLEAAEGSGVRKVKPIRGPDALMHAACAAFAVGLDRMRAAKVTDMPFHFPRYQKT